jgi:hypothetical protein
MSFDYWMIRSTKNNAILCEIKYGYWTKRKQGADLYWECQDRKSDIRYWPAVCERYIDTTTGVSMPILHSIYSASDVCLLGINKRFANSYRDGVKSFDIRRAFTKSEARNYEILLKQGARGTPDEDETISIEHYERSLSKAFTDWWKRITDRADAP